MPENHIFLGEFCPSDFNGTLGGYFDDTLKAVVYQSINTGEIFVGFRGTDNPVNLFKQDVPFLFGELSDDCRTFVEQVTSTVIRDYPYNEIILTGHSMAGSMSTYGSLITGLRSIGFDAPYWNQ